MNYMFVNIWNFSEREIVGVFVITCLIILNVLSSNGDRLLKEQVKSLRKFIKAQDNVNAHLAYSAEKQKRALKLNKKQSECNAVIVWKTKSGLLHNDIACSKTKKKRMHFMCLDRNMHEKLSSHIFCTKCFDIPPLQCKQNREDDMLNDVFLTEHGDKIHVNQTCKHVGDSSLHHLIRNVNLQRMSRFICKDC